MASEARRGASGIKQGCSTVLWVSLLLLLCAPWWLSSPAWGQVPLSAPSEVQVLDTLNDGGESLTVQWAPSPADSPNVTYQILMGDGAVTDPASLKTIAEFPASTHFVKDTKAAWWTRTAEK